MGILRQPPVPDGFTGTRLGVCNLCEAICGLRLTLEDGVVTGVRGNPDDPLSRGYVCPKGVALADVYADPDRLRRPVRRTDDGWVEIGWDEALDLVADRLAATITEHGADAVGLYSGNPNAHSLGFGTHGATFIKALGTRSRFSASSVDQVPQQLAAWQLFGHQLMIPVADIDRTSFLLVVGANPMASNGSLMTVPDFPQRVRDLHARDGRMVVLDPRRTETAKVADEHHFVRPGTDAPVLLAMVRTLLAEGLAAPPAYVDGLERLAELVEPFTPERAEAVSGVPAEVTRRLARELVAADAGAVYGRMGVTTQDFGTLCSWAIDVLNLLSGHFDSPGGVMFPEPAIDLVELQGPGRHGRWHSRVRGIAEYAGELPAAVMAEEMTEPGEGRLRAMVTVAGNPVLSTPDGRALAEALDGLDFMVAIDIYLNETTRHADVVLPPTSALERDQYDLVFHGFAVRNTARWTPAVHARGDDQRHDWEVFAALATRVADRLGTPLDDATAGRLAADPADLVELLLDAGGRTTAAEVLAHPEGVDLGPLRPTMPGRLRTPEQRIDVVPALVVDDLPRLEAWLAGAASAASDGDELLLIGRRHKQDCNSWLHNTTRLTRGRPRHHLLMHPDDLAARGLSDGERVEVRSRVGAVEVEVTGADDMMPGVVSLPHGYGHQVEGTRLGHASTVPGVSINDLTDPARLDVSGNAAFSGTPVTVGALSRP
ncbi:molybdopterin-dependent oxidoreductase [Nocardioides litoris]|uniref:molybdopterin-dependent oxidoreductase n=1 Tax=Nocardioides litoris TaxID=1926648 RepID=UPI001122D6CB|nr:molybdopterin-dependent oxidoreductase [Nocardioides litoris]